LDELLVGLTNKIPCSTNPARSSLGELHGIFSNMLCSTLINKLPQNTPETTLSYRAASGNGAFPRSWQGLGFSGRGFQDMSLACRSAPMT